MYWGLVFCKVIVRYGLYVIVKSKSLPSSFTRADTVRHLSPITDTYITQASKLDIVQKINLQPIHANSCKISKLQTCIVMTTYHLTLLRPPHPHSAP